LFLCNFRTIFKNKSFEIILEILFIKPKTSTYCLNQGATSKTTEFFLFIILSEGLSI